MVLILLLACLFGSYNQYKDRQLQGKQDALDNKRLFVRFISHEIRTPLNTVCLGLRLLKDEATATAGTVGKGRATNSEGNVFDLEEGLGAGENESSPLLPIEKVAAPTLALVKPNPVLLEKKKLLGWVDIIKDIEESSHNAVEVLNELMSYDKIEMKTLKIEMELVPMWAFINATIKPFYVQAKEKCIQLTLQVDPGSLSCASEEGRLTHFSIIGDSVRLAQIFRNLVSNALKFSGPNTEVKVTVSWMPHNLLAEGK
jgi:signal transduction histidine kinase